MDHLSKKQRSFLMSRISSKNTTPEMIVRSLLHSLGFRFRLHKKDLPGKPDIVLPKYSTVIFVNGCFWHQHNGCKDGRIPDTNRVFWENKLLKNVERDQRNIETLKKLGWKVVVIWECQTKNHDKLTKLLLASLADIF